MARIHHWITDGPIRVFCTLDHLVRAFSAIVLKLLTSQVIIILMTHNRHTACHMMAITCFDAGVEKNF